MCLKAQLKNSSGESSRRQRDKETGSRWGQPGPSLPESESLLLALYLQPWYHTQKTQEHETFVLILN